MSKQLVLPPLHKQQIQKKGFHITSSIASGRFGTVYAGTRTVNKTTEQLAVKVIDLTKTSDKYRNKFLPKELKFLKSFKHEFLVKTIDIMTYPNTVYVFMERAEGGDLIDLLTKDKAYKTGIPELKAHKLYKCVATAIEYIHSKGWAHRDIKCDNILLNKDHSVAKVTDFGCSTECERNRDGEHELRRTYCGTAQYNAPEVHRSHNNPDQPYDAFKSDVWSLGVVLYVMVNSKMPFELQLLINYSKQKPNKIDIDFPNKSLTTGCKDLIVKQLNINPKDRLSMSQVMSHQWIKQK